ncbi:O5AS1 protein, partial [Polypterus senegalus]|nr:O5AS1 protein [Polypterus senegalus]
VNGSAGSSTMKNSTVTVVKFILDCVIESPQNNSAVYIFVFIYLVTLIGNVLVILVIKVNRHLQTPMYLYIGVLAAMDVMSSTVLIPELVAILLHFSVIFYELCILQMFLIGYLELAVTFLFALMACDRYIAVLYPLRYPSLITNKTVWTTVLLLSVFSTAVLFSTLFLVSDLSFCHGNVLPYCFCNFFIMVAISCNGDQNYLISLSAMVPVFGVAPLAVIILSYVKIARAALKISTVDGKRKVFSTCLTHLIVVGIFYFPLLINRVLPGTGVKLSTEASNILVIIAHAIPPMMNPIVYSFRNNEIKSSIFKINNTVYIFIFIYLVTLIGNLLVILVIKMNRHLQTPMYLYIGTLAVIDLMSSTTMIPELVAILLHYSVVLYGLCMLQMFLIGCLELAVTLLFALMACDRYIAVLYPLRYPSLITNKTVWTAILLLNVFSAAVGLSTLFLVTDLSFCHGNVLPYCFCNFFIMVAVSCSEDQKYLITLSAMVPVFGAGPLTIIILSYVKIVRAALKIASVDGRQKVFSTCITHLIVVGIFYFPLLLLHVLPGSGVKLSTETSNILIIVAHAIPPMMNPIIYSFRNNEIKSSIFKINNTVYIFIFIYLVTLIGNFLVILVIKMNRHLQKPMYFYIGTLAVMDLMNSTTVIPELVAILLDYSVILYELCVLQMFLIGYMKVAITFIFALMACDRYIAVLYPLRYPSVITNKTVWTAILLLNVISTALLLPFMLLVSDISYCHGNILKYCFCNFYTMVDVSCNEDPKYVILLFTMIPLCGVAPLALIIFSYVKIAWAALRISSFDGKRKVFSTCLTHLIVVGMFYFPLLLFYVLSESKVKLSTETSNMLVIIAHAIPSMLNPVIYSFRNNEIKSSIYKIFWIRN